MTNTKTKHDLSLLTSQLELSSSVLRRFNEIIDAFINDHGMEPSYSEKISGVRPKYTKTIQSLLDANTSSRIEIKKLEIVKQELLEQQKFLEYKIEKLEERIRDKQLTPGYTPV